MKKIFIKEKCQNIHFIGIGGINMSALAEFLYKSGYNITGSDQAKSTQVEYLQSIGIKIAIGHNKENIDIKTNLVIYNAAVTNDNIELKTAIINNIDIMDRGKLLGLIMKNYNFPMCISGSHGKTTTTSMISQIFLDAKTSPTIMNGGILDSIGGSLYIGSGEHFIAEACEYHDSFLDFFPYIGIILNIDMDHADYFKDMDALRSSFKKFANLIPKNGTLIINKNIEKLDDILDNIKCNVILVDSEEGYHAKNIIYNIDGCASFDIYHKQKFACSIRLNVPGSHNIQNSLAAASAADILGIDLKDISHGLFKFAGANRRFQRKGVYNGAVIVDDYAHHPTEVETTLVSAKRMDYSKVWVVFQPHTQNRTKSFLNEFAKSLSIADEILLLDIYNPAGRDDGLSITTNDLFTSIKNIGKNCYYESSFENAIGFLKNNIGKNHLVITMGAGDVYAVGEGLLAEL